MRRCDMASLRIVAFGAALCATLALGGCQIWHVRLRTRKLAHNRARLPPRRRRQPAARRRCSARAGPRIAAPDARPRRVRFQAQQPQRRRAAAARAASNGFERGR